MRKFVANAFSIYLIVAHYVSLLQKMFKELLIFAALLALGTAAVIQSQPVENEKCQSETQMWGGADIRKVYFCVGGVVYSEDCRRNSYFVNNGTVSGCIPTANMNPDCVNTNTVGQCEGINLRQPQESTSLGNFYLCTGEGEAPIELKCPNNQAFLNQDGYMGCFDWDTWRSVRNCEP